MHGVALVLGLVAAGCLYAAAPNQVLLAQGSRTRGRWLHGAALALATIAIGLWSEGLGWAGAAIAVVLVVAGGLSLWPMAGAWVQQRRLSTRTCP